MDEHLSFSASNEFTQEFRHILARHTDERIRVSDGEYGEVDQGALDFGRFLRDLRTGREWTQAQLADKAKIPEATLFALEHGIIISTNVNRNVLFALARALDEDIDDFALILGREIPHPGVEGLRAYARNTVRDLVSYFGSKVGAIVFVLLVGLTMTALTMLILSLETPPGDIGSTSRPSTLFYASTLDYNLDTPSSNAPGASVQTSLVLTLFLFLVWYAIVKQNILIKLMKFNRQTPVLRGFAFIPILTFIITLISLLRCYGFESCLGLNPKSIAGELSPYAIWSISLAVALVLFAIIRGSRRLLRRITSHQLERGIAFATILILLGGFLGSLEAVHTLNNSLTKSNGIISLYNPKETVTLPLILVWPGRPSQQYSKDIALDIVGMEWQAFKDNTQLSASEDTTFVMDNSGQSTGNPWTIVITLPQYLEYRTMHSPHRDEGSYSYDSNGNLMARTTPTGLTTTYEYNALGQLITTTDPVGAMTTYEYDEDNKIQTNKYDVTGRLVAARSSFYPVNSHFNPHIQENSIYESNPIDWRFSYTTVFHYYQPDHLSRWEMAIPVGLTYAIHYHHWGSLNVNGASDHITGRGGNDYIFTYTYDALGRQAVGAPQNTPRFTTWINKFVLWSYAIVETILVLVLLTLLLVAIIREGRLISAFRKVDNKRN